MRTNLQRILIRLPAPLWIFVAAFVVLLAGAGLWVGLPIYREQAARGEIERAGGRIATRLRERDSLAELGNPAGRPVAMFVEVDLNGSRATDATLAYAVTLPMLGSLLLNNTLVGDAGLKQISSLKNLEALSLDHTHVTDAGLEHLRKLTGLQVLWLSGTNATANGIAELRRALPTTIIFVDRALEPPPDPVPPESKIVRFRFRHAAARSQTANGFKELPETEFGDLLFERNTGRCVYRYWFDGVHQSLPFPRFVNGKAPDLTGQPPDGKGSPLKAVVAFDGSRYWTADFDRFGYTERKGAVRIDVNPHRNDVQEHDGIDRRWVNLPAWCAWAPLHEFATDVGSDAIERNKLLQALTASRHAERLGPNAFKITARGWCYVISLNGSDLGIRRVAVQLAGGWAGHWPFPVPTCYSIERENAEEIDSKQLDLLTNPDTYADDSTVFVDR